ncbi:GNAT family N-acetyltransferase [Candidatus Pacearchaeota archaeon]|nr:GNAT family N-acetyltransferase [Candidatus Pacearchaeota archaeon]
MRIIKASTKDKKLSDKFIKKEWDIFNKERGYQWREIEHSFIASENKKILGILRFKIIGGASYLSEFIVNKESRNKSVGKKLFEKFEKFSKEKNCHVIYLETTEKHKEAIKFYKKMGFKKIATLKKNKFKFDCYFFEKILK